MPYLVEKWDFSSYELVLSDSASFGKGIICPPQTQHICYCHTPLRYAWDQTHQYQQKYPFSFLVRKLIPPALHYLRIWDRQAAQRPEQLLCNSHFIQQRIKKYYRRKAKVIPPPVRVKELANEKAKSKDYFLIVSRLIPYKKVDLAVKAFNKLGLPLKIIGDGPQYKKLKSKAKSNIEFLGSVYGESLTNYYKNCRAFILPQKEDFGIAPIEAMACGKPVLAYKKGGALDYLQEGVNGAFFTEQSPKCLQEAIKKIEKSKFKPEKIKKSVEKFDKKSFRDKIKKEVADKIPT